LGITLKNAGIESFTIYERAAAPGGVWRDNRYPGAACDVPSRLYSYSFEQDYDWSGRYGRQDEILAYLNHCITKYGLAPHIRFNTAIAGADYVDAGGVWTLKTEDGARIDAQILVSAVGLFNRPAWPDIPHREDFQGPQFHSANWDDAVDLEGKRVGVIGTGASAIQFVPRIAPVAGQLHVFQQSAQYVFPKHEPPPPSGWRAWADRSWPARRLKRLRVFAQFEGVTRRRASDKLRRAGEKAFAAHLKGAVADPDLRARLTPDYLLGCKRVLISNEWYPALQRPNVSLHDTPVNAVLPAGLRVRGGQTIDLDAIIYATGFTTSDYLAPMVIRGRDGRELNAAWREGAEAYLGITVAGFPNFFMLYGPNTNSSGSIVFMLESQIRYVLSALRAMRRRRAQAMEVREARQRDFNDDIQARIGETVLVHEGCHSYFQTASGKVVTQWPGFMMAYRMRTRRVVSADYSFG
ncbi:MAG: NAD(P)/FAD-dependent oxidoreductase, partial [Alphaproteobacteria bacterium]|nr:NAD(P)/FAD-dependent oxidoreductase [Alphaproteobacteria bacterium]